MNLLQKNKKIIYEDNIESGFLSKWIGLSLISREVKSHLSRAALTITASGPARRREAQPAAVVSPSAGTFHCYLPNEANTNYSRTRKLWAEATGAVLELNLSYRIHVAAKESLQHIATVTNKI